MISRSLKVPGSDSSALIGLVVCSGFGTKLALRPEGKPAPPRPRTLAVISSSSTAWRSMPSALRSDW